MILNDVDVIMKWFWIIYPIMAVVFLSIYIPYIIIKKRYTSFVLKHSVAIKELTNINKQYTFKVIPDFDMKHSYDNENFYADISCRDYLTYQLVFIQKDVKRALKDTLENKELFDDYQTEIKERCALDRYDTDELLRNKKRLLKYEKRLLKNKIKNPTIAFNIDVVLYLTNINGYLRTSKGESFSAREITFLITKINQKRGSFYLNEDIWQSICRVERGKVSNKMRFAVFNRDHNRCLKCKSITNLEIDHIVPIAKGGKTTFDNLQTLCHRCNVNKGTEIVDYRKRR